MVNDELLREIVKLERSILMLTLEVEKVNPKARDMMLDACIDMRKAFEEVNRIG